MISEHEQQEQLSDNNNKRKNQIPINQQSYKHRRTRDSDMQHFVSGDTLAQELEQAHQFFASMLAPLTLAEFQEHFFEKEALLVACQHQNNDQGNH